MTQRMQMKDIEDAECICPRCNRIYKRNLEVSYITNLDIWKRDGYIVMRCTTCKSSKENHADWEQGTEIEPIQLAVMKMRHYNRTNNNGGGIQ